MLWNTTVIVPAYCFVVARGIMPLKQVFSEIAVEIAPYRVDVIGIVLRVIELDQK